MAAPITGLGWLEASVGIISFGDLDVSVAGPLVSEAAKELGEALDAAVDVNVRYAYRESDDAALSHRGRSSP